MESSVSVWIQWEMSEFSLAPEEGQLPEDYACSEEPHSLMGPVLDSVEVRHVGG